MEKKNCLRNGMLQQYIARRSDNQRGWKLLFGNQKNSGGMERGIL